MSHSSVAEKSPWDCLCQTLINGSSLAPQIIFALSDNQVDQEDKGTRSVSHLKNKIFGTLFCVVLVLSIYVGFVYSLNELFGRDFIEMVSLSSQAHSKDDYRFAMGDTMLVSAKVRSGNVYRLNIYDNSDRLVSENVGTVNCSDMRVPVAIWPSVFNAGHVYNVSLIVGLVNRPLVGMSAVDSFTGPFEVVKSSTRLNLTTNWDEAADSLQSTALLMTGDGVPIENETVSFYLQPDIDFIKPDRGWILLGSVETDANGSALYSSALTMMGGLHGLEARFAGGQDYGLSIAKSEFNVSYRVAQVRIVNAEMAGSVTSVRLQLTYSSGFPLGGKLLSFEALTVTAKPLYAVTDDHGYAVFNFTGVLKGYFDSKITVSGDDYISRYQVLARLAQNGSEFYLSFKGCESGVGSLVFGEVPQSFANRAEFLTQGTKVLDSIPTDIVVSPVPESGRVDLLQDIYADLSDHGSFGTLNFTYYFNGTLAGVDPFVQYELYPGEEGHPPHRGYLSVWGWFPDIQGTYHIEVLAIDSYSGVEQEYGDAFVTVDRGNSNLLMYYPGAFCSDSLDLLVAFGKARSQDQNDGSGYFKTIDFAPTITWNNGTYALDEPTNPPIIKLYVNESNVANLTSDDGSGICNLAFSLAAYPLPCHLNVTAAIDATERFNGFQISQILNLTKISVQDDPAAVAPNSTSYIRYSMSILNDTSANYVNASSVYVNASNIVSTSVVILNNSAYNVMTFFTTGYLRYRDAQSNGNITIPVGCNYTLLRVVRACYSSNTSSAVNPATDVNANNITNMQDIATIIAYFNRKLGDAGYSWTVDVNGDGVINSKDSAAAILDFNKKEYLYPPDFNYSTVSVTCNNGLIPLDSRGFGSIPQGATWVNVSCPRAAVEFFNGTSIGSDTTDESGQSHITWKAPIQGFCVAEAWVQSPLNLTITSDFASSPLHASLITANYYYVLNRSVDVSVNWDSQMQTTILTPSADTYTELNNSEFHGNLLYMYVGDQSPERRIFVRFTLSDMIPANAYVVSARLNFYETGLGAAASNFSVYRVIGGQWFEENLTWSNMPSLNPTPSSTGSISKNNHVWSSFDVTTDVRYWISSPSSNYGLAVLASSGSSALRTLTSKEYSACPPSLQVCYLNGSRDVSVNAYDAAKRGPAQVNVNFSVNGTVMGNGSTNGSGVWDYGVWSPSAGGTWNLGAASSATSECKAGSTSSVFVLGLPTSMVSLDDGSQRLSKGMIVSNFSLCSSGVFNVSGVTVNFGVSGTYWNGTLYTCTGSSKTSDSGAVNFTWNAADLGSFSVHASFGGDTSYASCEAYALVSVNVLSLSVLFSISPSNFTPGQTVTLNATIMDPLTNSRSNHRAWVKFFNFSSDGSKTLGYSFSDEYGVALCSTFYPSDGKAYAFNATILNCTIQGVNLNVSNVVGSPVQLSVGSNTTLSLNVSSTSSPSQYKISGWLKSGISGLGNRLVILKINDTVVGSQLTDNFEGWRGYFSFVHDFPAVNNAGTTYTVSVSFNGTNAVSASATSITLGGSNYAMCTTIQYGNQPCSNSAMLTVDPQSTIAMISTKTPEEMQQEAEQSDWFRVEPEFSWCFPWFRLHYKLDVDLPQGNPKLDHGWSPLPFGESTNANSTVLASIMNDVTEGDDPEALALFFAALTVPLIIQATTCYWAGCGPTAIGYAVVLYAAWLILFNAAVFARNGANPKSWLLDFLGAAFVEMAEIFIPLSAGLDVWHLLRTGGRLLLQKIHDPLNALRASKMAFFAIAGAIFVLMDFAVMLVYLGMYLASVL